MPTKTFDETIAGLQLSAEEKKLLDNTLTKHPELKDGWLRQDEFSRRQTEIAAKEQGIEAVKTRNTFLEEWGERVVPIWEKAVEEGAFDEEGKPLWKEQLSKKDQELAEARATALAGDDMKPEELDKRVKDIIKAAGGVTSEEEKALRAQESRKIAQEEFSTGWKSKETEFNEKTIPFVNGFATATAVMALKYEKESGESWSREKQIELHKAMEKEQNFDPYVMVDKMIATHRDKKKMDDEVEKRAQDRLKVLRAESGGNDDYIPQGGPKPKGSLQQMLDRSAEKDGDFMATIDRQAKLAGSELREEGKVGVA